MIVTPALYGTNLFVYCGNDPVNMVDPNGMFGEAVIAKKVLEVVFTVGIIVISTTLKMAKSDFREISFTSFNFDVGIGTIDLPQTKARETSTLYVRDAIKEKIAATDQAVPKPDYSAQYYGAYVVKGYPDIIIMTPSMDYLEALNWAWITAYNGRFTKRKPWGLYTLYNIDAAIMAKGLGDKIYHETADGVYPHYHVVTNDDVGFYGYSHFHVWYGGI